jgi:hypothetical protein
MKGSIIEINNQKKVNGRVFVKWVIHEIHNTTEKFNRNGISWKEEYVLNNIDSIKGMPICAEFLDGDKSEPYGHGESGIKDGKPLFEYSVVVGVADRGYIDTIEVNGEEKRVLIGEGWLYEQRYPNFLQWLKSKMYDNEFPETSVEIAAKEGNELIIYEDGWKEEGRVPMVYDYTGDAILGITPADPSAVLLELNQYKEVKKMSDKNEKVILELNEKIESKTNEINQLKDELKQKESAVSELNEKLETKQTELNAAVEELNEVKQKLEQSESKLQEVESELNELRKFKQDVENQKLVAELNEKLAKYTDEEKEVVKEKVETFQKQPSKDLMNEIISEINSHIAQQILAKRQKEGKKSEVNSVQVDDIYGDVIDVNDDNLDDIY